MPIDWCESFCTHFHIEEELKAQALTDEYNISRQKRGSPTTVDLNKRRDYIGSISQNGVPLKLDDWDIRYKSSPYFIPGEYRDGNDLEIFENDPIDIQGQTIGIKEENGIKVPYLPIRSNSWLWVKNEKKDREPRPSKYLFCIVDPIFFDTLHIVGTIDYDKFWSIAVEKPNMPYPCKVIEAHDTQSFRDYVYKT